MYTKIIVLMTLLVGAITGGTAIAADQSVPGDFLHPVDRAFERVQLRFSSNDAKEAQIRMEIAEERLQEAEVLQEALDLADEELGEEDDPLGRCAAVSENTHPKAENLSDTFEVPYEEIMDWFCEGFGFGEITIAFSLSAAAEVPVEDLFALKDQGYGWGEIVAQVELPAAEEGDEAPEPSEIIKVESDRCENLPDPVHPKGDKLADEIGVPYEEIMDWFCSGFGFGEVDLAYDISQAASVPVEEVFQARADGLGWGRVMKEFGTKPGGGPPEDKPGKGPNK